MFKFIYHDILMNVILSPLLWILSVGCVQFLIQRMISSNVIPCFFCNVFELLVFRN